MQSADPNASEAGRTQTFDASAAKVGHGMLSCNGKPEFDYLRRTLRDHPSNVCSLPD
jgi:hypothetical protein